MLSTIHSWTSDDMTVEVALVFDSADNDYGAILFVEGREIMNSYFDTEAEALRAAKEWRENVRASVDDKT